VKRIIQSNNFDLYHIRVVKKELLVNVISENQKNITKFFKLSAFTNNLFSAPKNYRQEFILSTNIAYFFIDT